MVKKFKTLVTVMTLMVGMVFVQDTTIFAGETSVSKLAPYEVKLEQLNESLGTDYQLQPSEGCTYDEMAEYFNDMTLTEFETYVRNAYKAEQEMDAKMKAPIHTNSNVFSTFSTLGTQRYYYNGSNYLYLRAYTTTVSGSVIYTGDVDGTGSVINSYPAYKSRSCAVSFSSDKKTASCSWKCVKYLNKNLISATDYTVNCTFAAGGGNVYITV